MDVRKNKSVEIWLDLINAETESDLERIEASTNDKDIHDIISTIREMSADEKIRHEAEMREKAIRDEHSALAFESCRYYSRAVQQIQGRTSVKVNDTLFKTGIVMSDCTRSV